MTLFLFLCLPFLGSLVTALLPTKARTVHASIAGAIAAAQSV